MFMIPLILVEQAVEYLIEHHLDEARELGKQIAKHFSKENATDDSPPIEIEYSKKEEK